MGYHMLICDKRNSDCKREKEYLDEFSKKMQIKGDVRYFSEKSSELDSMIKNDTVDIALLDIGTETVAGIELAKQLLNKNPWTIIIFLSDSSLYMEEAFQIQAFGYMKKPVDKKRLEWYFIKAVYLCEMIKYKRISQTLTVKHDRKVLKIRQSEIIYLEKIQRKVIIHTIEEVYEVYDSMMSIEEQLSKDFIRVNQGVIIKINAIDCIERNSVFIRTGQNFPIGRTYAKRIKELCI